MKHVNETAKASVRDDIEQPSNIVRLSLNVSREVSDVAKELARRRGLTVTETVRRAIGVLKFMDEVEARGGRIYVEEDDRRQEVVFIA